MMAGEEKESLFSGALGGHTSEWIETVNPQGSQKGTINWL